MSIRMSGKIVILHLFFEVLLNLQVIQAAGDYKNKDINYKLLLVVAVAVAVGVRNI